jgi:Transposase DDE domain
VSASGDRSPFEEVLHIGIMVVTQAAHGHALLVSLQLPSDIAVLAAVVGIQRETTVSPQLALGTETVGRLQRRLRSIAAEIERRGIELIAPYRKNNKERKYEDGRKLRRYKRRWIIERTNAWLGQFRRLLVRHEHLLSTYSAFFYLACLRITLRKCL